jgi:hypothetical protein
MQTYLVRRPGVADNAGQLDAALVRLRSFEETPHAAPARWLHSYALREADGRFGLACIFQADAKSTLLRHAQATRLPASEILPVVGDHIVRTMAPTLVYLIRRRNVWQGPLEFELGTASFRRAAEAEVPHRVSWLRSYALREANGTLGSACLFQGVDSSALVEHAARSGVPADEITPVIGRIVYRDVVEAARMTDLAGITKKGRADSSLGVSQQ